MSKIFKKVLVAATPALVALGIAAPVQAQSEPFIGQLMLVGYNFCPRGWTEADGQLLPIAQNTALFSLYGTTYGGDGRTTFALPDLRGRYPMHTGTGPGLSPRPLGQKSGVESVTLNVTQIASHNHGATTTSTLRASAANGNSNDPSGRVLANDGTDNIYFDGAPDVNMRADAVQSSTTVQNNGGNQAHDNMPPFLVLRWCVALQGIFPSRN